MKYEDTPRPLIEDHYHIRELIERQERRAEDRNDYRQRQKNSEERVHTLNDSKLCTVTDFWCKFCEKDFKAQSIREIQTDWTNPSQQIAFYRTKHFCGTWCMRLITDRHRDAFWTRSKLARSDQGQHYADTLQPFETGYEMLYSRKRKDV